MLQIVLGVEPGEGRFWNCDQTSVLIKEISAPKGWSKMVNLMFRTSKKIRTKDFRVLFGEEVRKFLFLSLRQSYML